MHHQRIVHLDIKPNNIMFATSQPTDLRIKVIDLGLARELGGSEKVLALTSG
jgi:serine/threonine protein kinase